jgi:FtsZ-interacting cell division protein YlmF
MTAQKQTDTTASRNPATSKAAERKPWKKKTPVQVVLDQAEKLRRQIGEKEEELKVLRRQLQKFEEAKKIFESA